MHGGRKAIDKTYRHMRGKGKLSTNESKACGMTQRDETRIRWYVRRNAKGMDGKQDGGCHDNRVNAIGRGYRVSMMGRNRP